MKLSAIACLLLCAICQAQTRTTAQTVTVGPVTTGNKLAWSMANGDTAALAQAFEARVRVDGATVPLVLSGVSCSTTTLTDVTGALWTLGLPAVQTVLRNGQLTGGLGNAFSLVNGTIYVLGTDVGWWKWNGTMWLQIVATDPTPAVLAAASVSRWTCQANLTQSLVVTLNIVGPHQVVLRLYDTVTKTCGVPAVTCESIDSTPFTLNTPEIVAQPVTVRITQ